MPLPPWPAIPPGGATRIAAAVCACSRATIRPAPCTARYSRARRRPNPASRHERHPSLPVAPAHPRPRRRQPLAVAQLPPRPQPSAGRGADAGTGARGVEGLRPGLRRGALRPARLQRCRARRPDHGPRPQPRLERLAGRAGALRVRTPPAPPRPQPAAADGLHRDRPAGRDAAVLLPGTARPPAFALLRPDGLVLARAHRQARALPSGPVRAHPRDPGPVQDPYRPAARTERRRVRAAAHRYRGRRLRSAEKPGLRAVPAGPDPVRARPPAAATTRGMRGLPRSARLPAAVRRTRLHGPAPLGARTLAQSGGDVRRVFAGALRRSSRVLIPVGRHLRARRGSWRACGRSWTAAVMKRREAGDVTPC